MKSKFILFLIGFFICGFAFSQVQFEAEVSRKKLGINERLRVDFIMNEDGDNFNPPDFTNFRIVGGPNQSISYSYLNGKRTYQKKYSYYLQPTKRGKFNIGQAEIQIEGEIYKTTPVAVEVTTAVDKPTDGNNSELIASDNIHLVAEISKANPYLNEGISLQYKLYVSPRVDVSDWRPIDSPKYTDFWSQNIDIGRLQVKNGTYKGEDYRYVVLQQTVLYPQKTGKLTIEPLTLNVSVQVPSDRRDIFGRRISETIQKTIAADRKVIQVKSLPTEGKPTNFTGAVGSFNFSVSTTKNTLNATESLQAKVRVSGNGNLKLFQLPKLTTPGSLEVYEPEHQEDVKTNMNGMYGSITDSYTIVPQLKGKYPISPVAFSYFDVRTESYKTITSEELMVNVENGPTQLTNGESTTTAAATKKQVVPTDKKQFRYLKLNPNLQEKAKQGFFKSTLFWILLIVPFLAIPLAIIFGKKREAYKNDVQGKRLRKADKLAKKYLSEAKKNLGNQQAFYESLERALHNYLRAKLSIQTGEMSKEKIKKLLTKKGATQEDTKRFIGLLESCEYARYTPASKTSMEQDYQKAVEVIAGLDKQI